MGVQADRMADALIIGHMGQGQHVVRAQEEYMRRQPRPYMRVVKAVLENNLLSEPSSAHPPPPADRIGFPARASGVRLRRPGEEPAPERVEGDAGAADVILGRRGVDRPVRCAGQAPGSRRAGARCHAGLDLRRQRGSDHPRLDAGAAARRSHSCRPAGGRHSRSGTRADRQTGLPERAGRRHSV